MTDYGCPGCGGLMHTDDLLEGECVTQGCGETFPPGLGPRNDLPEYDPESAPDGEDSVNL